MRSFAWVVLSLLFVPAIAEAQERPFLFSFSSSGWEGNGGLVYYEAGYAERVPTALARDGFEHRLGFEARFAQRLSVLSALSLADEDGSYRAAVRAEALYDLVDSAAGFSLSAGGGYLREPDGTSVALGRLVADGRWGAGWRATGNLRLERPFARGRDGVDVITSFGLSRSIADAWGVGVEAVGEDLEAFWEEEEAEGGGRLMVGPSVRFLAPDSWLSASLSGGPVFTVRPNPSTSGAVRNLGTGTVIRLSLACRF